MNETQNIALAPLESPFRHGGISDEQWTAFVRASMTAPTSAVSASNALGAFELKPRRLADLGLVCNLRQTRSKKSGRTIWVGTFVAPLTTEHFLKNLAMQFRAFSASMSNYANRITQGEIEIPQGASLSGALAILHRAGVAGLKGVRMSHTTAAFERANGIF